MKLQILDLDGSLIEQKDFYHDRAVKIVPLREWGPSIRICCSFSAFRRFEETCKKKCLQAGQDPVISFFGSGDFHHVTLSMLRQLHDPFNVLVLDKHPDWMCGAPLMHCGTWVAHAVQLPNLQHLFHLGGALDLENWLYRFAPWKHLSAGRVKVVPALKKLTRGRWRSVAYEPLRAAPAQPLSVERLESLCADFQSDMARFPLYISIDKDVMRASEAPTNWDSGYLELDEVRRIVTRLVGTTGAKVIGMDVLGDWSRPVMHGLLRKILNKTEHPAIEVQPERAMVANSRTNRILLETFMSLV